MRAHAPLAAVLSLVVLVAGAFLILTGIKIIVTPEAAPDPGANPLLRLVKRLVPVTTTIDGTRARSP